MTAHSKIINVNITFRNSSASEPLKQYAGDKITKLLQKFVHHDTEAHVVLSVEKTRHIAEVSFRTDGADFVCKEESGDLYASIDAVSDALARQLRSHKEKLTERR